MYEAYNTPSNRGHLGVEKTLDKLAEHFYWPKMSRMVRRYIHTCDECQRIKPLQQAPQGLLQPLDILEVRWQQISMDFIGPLPKSEQFDCILVVVDRLTKMSHFIPTTTTVTAPEVARLFIDNIYRLHGLPTSIVSDRDPWFTSHFWTELTKSLGTQLKMSTAFHPQTDGQSERMNRTLEQMLRAYVNWNHNDWSNYLSFIEFTYNNSINTATQYSPFELMYGEQPLTSLNLLSRIETSSPHVSNLFDLIQHKLHLAQNSLAYSQEYAATHANLRRREGKPWNIGDKVLLSTKHLRLPNLPVESLNKLQQRYTSSFEIIKIIMLKLVYKLKLLFILKIYPIFHIFKLKKYIEDIKFKN